MRSIQRRIAVVGAGISGLALARGLRGRGVETVLFEASARAGGVLRSSRQNGRLLEWGPQRLRLSDRLRGLVEDLDLADELLFAPPDAPLYVLRRDELHAVPRSLRALLIGRLLSPAARFRVLLEPLTAPVRETETVAEAFRRKFGDEAYRVLLGPLFGGLYASDPADMRCRDSLSKFVARVGAPRSLLLRGLAVASGRRAPAACSFVDGVARLPEALAMDLGTALRLERPVETVFPERDGWMVALDRGRDGSEIEGPFAAVVLAVPADRAARVLERAVPAAADRLGRLRYNRLAVVHLEAAGDPIPGFGYQVAFGEPLETRGVTFNDALFGRIGVVTAFLGGARNAQLPGWPDERIAALAETEYRRATGRRATTIEVSRPAVPAYDMSWRWLDDLRLPPGLHLCAGYLERAGVTGRLDQAARLARTLT